MPAVKRASDGQSSAAKRSCPSKPELSISLEEQMKAMEKVDLISHILELQACIASAAKASPSPPAVPKLSKEEMKWKPSCKTGSARFSYSAVVASRDVFLSLFRLAADWKQKQVQFDPAEFQDTTHTHISTSIRYGHLNVIGSKVTVRWDANELTFTVTGSYGL
ncbi:MAG: hypothetical protein Q9223_002410 [Gallowayella weberi]